MPYSPDVYTQAREAGLTDEQIANNLSEREGHDINLFLDEGLNHGQIARYFTGIDEVEYQKQFEPEGMTLGWSQDSDVEEGTTPGDYSRSLAIGLNRFGQTLGRGVDVLGNIDPTRLLTESGEGLIDRAGQKIESFYKEKEAEDYANLSPDMKKSMEKKYTVDTGKTWTEAPLENFTSLFKGDAWKDPAKMAGSMLQSAPSTAVGMGTGMAITGGLLKTALVKSGKLSVGMAGVIGGFIGEGSTASVESGKEVYDLVVNAPIDVLSQTEEYQKAIQNLEGQNLSDAEKEKYARELVADHAAVKTMGVVFGATGLLGSVSGHYMGKIIGGEATGGLVRKALTAGGTETLQEAPQSGFEILERNIQKKKYVDPNQDIWEGVKEGAIEGAVQGFGMGLVMGGGAATIQSIDPAKAIQEEDDAGLDQALEDSVNVEEPVSVDEFEKGIASSPSDQYADILPFQEALSQEEMQWAEDIEGQQQRQKEIDDAFLNPEDISESDKTEAASNVKSHIPSYISVVEEALSKKGVKGESKEISVGDSINVETTFYKDGNNIGSMITAFTDGKINLAAISARKAPGVSDSGGTGITSTVYKSIADFAIANKIPVSGTFKHPATLKKFQEYFPNVKQHIKKSGKKTTKYTSSPDSQTQDNSLISESEDISESITPVEEKAAPTKTYKKNGSAVTAINKNGLGRTHEAVKTEQGWVIRPFDTVDIEALKPVGQDRRQQADFTGTDQRTGEDRRADTTTRQIVDEFAENEMTSEDRQTLIKEINDKRTDDMSMDELRTAMKTNYLTAMGNRRAYNESEKKPVQASLDVDSLAWVNDNISHSAGDKVLKHMAKALKHDKDAYHISGDEFMIQGNTEAEVQGKIDKAYEYVDKYVIEFTDDKDQLLHTLKLGFSYGKGTGKTNEAAIEESEQNLQKHKNQREADNLRSKRKHEPKGLVSTVPEGQNQNQKEVTTPESPVKKALGNTNTTVKGQDGRAYILEDLAEGIYKAGMSLADFTKQVADKLGNAYNKVKDAVIKMYHAITKSNIPKDATVKLKYFNPKLNKEVKTTVNARQALSEVETEMTAMEKIIKCME